MKIPGKSLKEGKDLSYLERTRNEKKALYVGLKGSVIGFHVGNIFFRGRLEGRLKGEEVELKRIGISAGWANGKRFEIIRIDPNGNLVARLL